MSDIKATTKGEWICTTSAEYVPGGEPVYIAVASYPTGQIIAILGSTETEELKNEHMANAALIASAPAMLDALIAIQEAASMNMLDAESINAMISDVFAKLANEAGEEL
jgi:hypothetical protein